MFDFKRLAHAVWQYKYRIVWCPATIYPCHSAGGTVRGPLATLRLHQAGYGLCPIPVSKYRASPISSRAMPGTQTRGKWLAADELALFGVKKIIADFPL